MGTELCANDIALRCSACWSPRSRRRTGKILVDVATIPAARGINRMRSPRRTE